jgi:hydroxymethylpyrimidine/phosphomethylpyrimidine kinase
MKTNRPFEPQSSKRPETAQSQASRPQVLLVGGTDPSGGAGLAADLKSVAALGGHGALAVTAVTVQNSGQVRSWTAVDPDQVEAQMKAVFDDGSIDAVKSGMLGGAKTARKLADVLETRAGEACYVLDPVLVAGSGDSLSRAGLVEVVREALVSRAMLCTPNLDEAARLVGFAVKTAADMERAGNVLCEMGAQGALVKGGHLPGPPRDVLVTEAGTWWFEGRRLVAGKVHGTGCSLASSLAVLIGAGHPLHEAVEIALGYLRQAITASFPRRFGRLLAPFPPLGWGAKETGPQHPPRQRGAAAEGSVDDATAGQAPSKETRSAVVEAGASAEAFYAVPRFCPHCGAELHVAPQQDRHLHCARCSMVFYRNPLPVSTLLYVREGKLLLVRRARAPRKDELCLPGGFLELGETIWECGRRELAEETHLEAHALRLLSIEHDQTAYGGIMLVGMEVEGASGTPRAGDDASELLWMELDTVPNLAFAAHDRFVELLRTRRTKRAGKTPIE